MSNIGDIKVIQSWSTMANQMLAEVFQNSHPDLVGMEISPATGEKENETPPVNLDSSTSNQCDGENNASSSKPSSFKQGALPSRKSVEFAVLPPTKRVRHAAEWTTKQAVEGECYTDKPTVFNFLVNSKPSRLVIDVYNCTAVATAVGPEDRLRAIEGARETFGHDLQSLHDEELNSGADAILTKHLAFVLLPLIDATPSSNQLSVEDSINNLEDVTRELSLTLESLESIYKASSDAVGRSFKRVGKELVRLIMTTLIRELGRRVEENLVFEDQRVKSKGDDCDCSNEGNMGSGDDDIDGDERVDRASTNNRDSRCKTPPELVNEGPQTITTDLVSPEGDIVIRHCTRILGHFARVGNVTKTLAHSPGLLGLLVNLITLYPYDRIPFEARLAGIWTLANLGCNGENMQMMVGTPGLIGGLVRVSCRCVHPGDTVERTVEILRGRSIASRCILNLSWDSENKVVLGTNEALVDLLAELAVNRHSPMAKSRTVREILVATRRHAVGALRNLAAAPRRSKLALVAHKDGHLLTVLTDAALNDPDQFVTDRALAAISNLAIQDTAQQLVKHPALILALKNVLLSTEEEDKSAHEEGTPRSHASATLLVLERSIRPEMPAYQNLRNLLDALNPSMSDSDAKLDEYSGDPMKVEQITAV